MAEEKAIRSRITFPYLRKFNGTMSALRFIQAVLMLVGVCGHFAVKLNYNLFSFLKKQAAQQRGNTRKSAACF